MATVCDYAGFDAEADVMGLRKAMKGLGKLNTVTMIYLSCRFYQNPGGELQNQF